MVGIQDAEFLCKSIISRIAFLIIEKIIAIASRNIFTGIQWQKISDNQYCFIRKDRIILFKKLLQSLYNLSFRFILQFFLSLFFQSIDGFCQVGFDNRIIQCSLQFKIDI